MSTMTTTATLPRIAAPARRVTALQKRIRIERTALVLIIAVYMIPVLWLVAMTTVAIRRIGHPQAQGASLSSLDLTD